MLKSVKITIAQTRTQKLLSVQNSSLIITAEELILNQLSRAGPFNELTPLKLAGN